MWACALLHCGKASRHAALGNCPRSPVRCGGAVPSGAALFRRSFISDQRESTTISLRPLASVPALIGRPGLPDEDTGEPLLHCAHPIFGAPFVLVGDSGCA